MKTPIISFRNVSKRYGNQEVLKNITVDIWPGELTFIMGPSGVGKTVFLRLALGFEEPDEGEIHLAGIPLSEMHISELSAIRVRHIFIFQHPALFDFLTVIENVGFPLLEHHPDMDPPYVFEKAKGVLRSLGYRGTFKKMPDQCTVGEAKLVSIARALMLNPKVMFIDEPTTGLDETTRTQVDHILVNTHRMKQCSCIVVSHDVNSALTIGDRILFFYDTQLHANIENPRKFTSHPDPLVNEFFNHGEVF